MNPKGKFPPSFLLLLAIVSVAHADKIDEVLDGLGEVSVRGQHAQEMVETIGPAEMRELVIRGLKREKVWTREMVLSEVADRKMRELYPLIIEAGKKDPEWRVRSQAVESAGRLMDLDGADFIRSALNDKNPEVQATAITYVSGFGDKADTKVLREKLTSNDHHVQLAAAKALIERGEDFDKMIVTQYIEISSAASWDRNMAIQLLGEIGDQDDSRVLAGIIQSPKANGGDKFEAMVSVIGIQFRGLPESERLEFLKSKLSDKRDSNRSWAAKKLLETPGGLNVLMDASADKAHPGCRNAADAIADSKTPRWKRLHSK